MSNIYASRAQVYVGGAPLSAFSVGQADIIAIYLQFALTQSSVNALNYTPSDIAVIPNTRKINLVFEYGFSNTHAPFDFSSLPYAALNVQALLFSELNTPFCLISNVFFRGDNFAFPHPGTNAKRSVILGALNIQYFGI